MLQRILEPEVMDTVAEAEDYNAMDHSAVNGVFVDDFLMALQDVTPESSSCWTIFDAGTGTALIPLELVRRNVPVAITAADLAEEMLVVARRNLAAAGDPQAIQLVRGDCKRIDFADGTFDAVISNSIVHHIPEPVDVFRECWRIVRPGGLLFIRDLMRPTSVTEWNHLVETHAGSANAHAQQMFRDSLHAALMVEEVAEVMRSLGIPGVVRATSDRHWTLTAIKD